MLASKISRRRLALFAIGLGFLNLAVFYWAAGPLFKDVRLARAAIAERERTYYEYAVRAQDFERAQSILAGIRADPAKLRSFFLAPENVLTFVLALEANARVVGVRQELALIGEPTVPAPGKTEAGANRLNLSVSAEGDFPALIKYLGLVENMPYFLRVENARLSLASGNLAGDDRRLKLSYRLSVAVTRPIDALALAP